MIKLILTAAAVTAVTATNVQAQDLSEMQRCLLDKMNTGNADATVADVRAQCEEQLRQAAQEDVIEVDAVEEPGALINRIRHEQDTQFDPFVLTPHRRNYLLPFISTNNLNRLEYADIEDYEQNLESHEAKFQISFKVPFNKESLLFEDDQLFFGLTIQSWWQIYSDNISKPFRETNYMPELFYGVPTGWHPFGTNTAVVFGAEHLSNGRSQPLSRSWNRFYAQFVVEKGRFVFALKPWIRLQEDAKTDPMQARGDDNPNITDYVGDYEFATVYNNNGFEYTLRLRHAIETGRGSAELNWTFPLGGKFIGYTSIFTGYGESLIDYNHKQTRFGIGIALNNVL